MKKIGIDARLYFQTGVGTYVKNLLFYLNKLSTQNIIFYVYVLNSDFHKIILDSHKFKKISVNSRWHSLSEQTIFLHNLLYDDLDLMHFTYFGYPALYQKKFVATVHDITPLMFKTGMASNLNPFFYNFKHFAYKVVLSSQINNSHAIFTPSYVVRTQICNYFKTVNHNKIIVTHEGVSVDFLRLKNEDIIFEEFKTDNFFLYVGNFYPHKNVDLLLGAFTNKNLSKKNLVLVGPNNQFCENLKRKYKKNNIFFRNNVSEAQLAFLYKNATALISPALFEGFGLPILEANYFNCPVVLSSIDVFKEVMGNKAVYFNPKRVDELVNILTKFKKSKVIPISGDFSFEEMTKKTLSSYYEAV